MTPDEYVMSILNKYRVAHGPTSPAEALGGRVAGPLRRWAADWLAALSYSGSYAKGTGVGGVTDADLFISLKSGTPGTLGEIYESLYDFADRQRWQPRRQDVSIGIKNGGTAADLVPGRMQEGHTNYHSLYRRKTKGWTQTNVSLHVSTVTGSGRVDEIRAVKIWRSLRQLDWASFYLELFVIEVLKGKPRGALASNVMSALTAIGLSLENAIIIDPANTNNRVSDDLNTMEKKRIAGLAAASATAPSWGQIIW